MWVHRLSDIDPEQRTAVCAECGPVTVRRKNKGWRCNVGHPKGKQRRKYGVVKSDVCARCGFIAQHPCQMDIHHINHDHSDNRVDNLETLCANCHRLHHFGET